MWVFTCAGVEDVVERGRRGNSRLVSPDHHEEVEREGSITHSLIYLNPRNPLVRPPLPG